MPIVRLGRATAVRVGTTLRRGLPRLTAGAPTSRHNGVTAGRHTTATAVTPSSRLIRHGPTLRRAAAIRHRLDPTLRLAAVTAPVAEAATVAGAAILVVMVVGAVTAMAVVEVIPAVAVGAVTTVAEGVVAPTVVEGVVAPTVAVVAVAGHIDNSWFYELIEIIPEIRGVVFAFRKLHSTSS